MGMGYDPAPWIPERGLTWTSPPGPFDTPAGVLPPPGPRVEIAELQTVRRMNSMRHADQFTQMLSERGDRELWFDFARQYRRRSGFLRGWVGTGLMAAAMGVSAIQAMFAKNHYERLRPYQVDRNIRPIGGIATDPSYPSGHTTSAYAASTVLAHLWPQRAVEFNWWAQQVGLSRMAAGMHWPSDVVAGARLGQRVGLQISEVIGS